MKKLIVIWLLHNSFFAFGQEVNKEFTKLLLNEQFEQVEKSWNSTFNADNLFIGQNGYFELFRKSKKSGYYLFPKLSEDYNAFSLETSVIFGDHNNKRQSAGLIMMANSETGGGLSVEINQKKEYRIVRVYKDRQVPINGSINGWVKASYAITKVENVISINSYDKVYDLYINGKFIQSFTDIELNKGKIGIYVGPDSKVKFDYLKILGEDKTDLIDLDVSNLKGEEQAFTQIILRLKEQMNRKDKEIDDYKTKLKLCESGGSGITSIDTGIINQRNRLNARVSFLESENDNLQMNILQLESELKSLQNFKEGVEKGDDGDIVINLTNMVSNQKLSIEGLEKKNKSLNDENNSLFMETKQLTKALDLKTNESTGYQASNIRLKYELDSLYKLLKSTRDSLKMNGSQSDSMNPTTPAKKLTEEEKLQQMIEKEREERRKRKEEEMRKKEEEEKQNNDSE